MDQVIFEKLKRSLTLHEGRSKYPYVDTVGKVTIGIGYNLTDRGIDDQWIDNQFMKDVNYFYDQLSQYDWFNELNEDRKVVLVDMSFMGIKRLLTFQRFIHALENKDYKLASYEMMDSVWAKQVKGRAEQLSKAMLSGIYTI